MCEYKRIYVHDIRVHTYISVCVYDSVCIYKLSEPLKFSKNEQ